MTDTLPVTLAEIEAARERIAPHLAPTPLEPASALGPNVWLKLENLNRTRSFKCRGALNAMLSLSPAERARGIVAASSGNHAQGVALAASLAGASARIYMPAHTPRRKIDGVRHYGAEAVLYGYSYDDCEIEARRVEREDGLTFISPYNDARVIAGAGTIGLEIAEVLPEVGRVLVCAGGGGLISGVGVAIRALRPGAEIIGVCAQAAPALYNVLVGGSLPQIDETLAEALSGEIEAGSITIDLARRVVDRCVLVAEEAIAQAVRWLAFEAGWIVEGGGAVGVAALRTGLIPADDRPTVVILSGGNIDGGSLRQVLCGAS
jgi:threonine dehydratase